MTFGAKVLEIFVLMIRQFHRNESSWNVRSRETKVPQERKFQGANVPWNESSTGAKVLSMVFSLPGSKVQRNEKAWNQISDPPEISKTTRARMLKLKNTIRYCEVLALGKKNISARKHPGGVGPPSVNLGPPNISESKRARKLKLKTPLEIVTFSPRIQKNFR